MAFKTGDTTTQSAGLQPVAPPPPPPQFGLANVNPYIECKGLWYNKQRLRLDGYRFENCRFDGCILDSASGNFELVNCFIDSETLVYHGNSNMKVLKLFNRNNDWSAQQMPNFSPTFNDDGTITIV